MRELTHVGYKPCVS